MQACVSDSMYIGTLNIDNLGRRFLRQAQLWVSYIIYISVLTTLHVLRHAIEPLS